MENLIGIQKIKNIIRYVALVFAFVCCGFIFNNVKIEAAPTISIPDNEHFDYKTATGVNGTGLSLYIGYDVFTVTELKYKFNENDSWMNISNPDTNYYKIYKGDTAEKLCVNNSSFIISCTDVILEYRINNLPSSFSTGIKSDGTFTIWVESANSRLFLGGSSSASRNLIVDKEGPKIKSVSVTKSSTASGNVLKIGDSFQFNIMLDSSSYISSGVKMEFKLGTVTKQVSCTNSGSTNSTSFSCQYTVVQGDKGTISSLKLVNANKYIKDEYGNYMESDISVTSFNNSSNLSVDGENPYIKNIIVTEEGTYSSGMGIPVKVTFSESLKATNASSMPVLLVKFGTTGITKTCTFVNGVEADLIYTCTPEEADQGKMYFVGISGGIGVTDLVGNSLNLSTSGKTFDLGGAFVDNSVPSIDSVSFTSSNCTISGSSTYCKADGQITITYKFNTNVTIKSNQVNLYFGGVKGKNSLSSVYDNTKKTFTIGYVVSSNDNGMLEVSYLLNVEGSNGKTNNISSSQSFDCYVDNKAPSINNMNFYYNDNVVTGNVIYGSPSSTVIYKADVSEDSQVILDSSKVYLVDNSNNRLSIGLSSDIVSVVAQMINKELVVRIIFSNQNSETSFKVKVEKTAIKDYFGNYMDSDIYSDFVTFDSKAPEFEVTLEYPSNKSLSRDGKKILVSGNEISFKIESEDKDLKDYCVVSSVNEVCKEYLPITSSFNAYEFNNKGDGIYSFYVRVRDTALNTVDVVTSFNVINMFKYSNGIGVVSKSHSITVNVALLNTGETFKYSWFKKGSSISFNHANTSVNSGSEIVVDGVSDYNGEYQVCINGVDSSVVLCSEYVVFDTKIDSFDVSVSDEWTNQNISTSITFNDASSIKCIAVGMNVSTPNCNSTSDYVTIYKTAQAISPFSKYIIKENGVYTFYIEDVIGNSLTKSITVDKIDKVAPKIQLFNGNSKNYNTNLEIDFYKSEHKFLITFDKDDQSGSPHDIYSYFFSTSNYLISNKDSFYAYYYKNTYKEQFTNNARSITISTPSVNNTYNLYVMAVDKAGNVSFKTLSGIKVDAIGPKVTMYNENNVESNGGSEEFIAEFKYNVVVEDLESKLDLNRIYYKWIDSNTEEVILEKKYDRCAFSYTTCIVEGKYITFSDVFNSSSNYKFVLVAYDNANNETIFTSNSFKIDTIAPEVTIEIDVNKDSNVYDYVLVNESEWYSTNEIRFTVSKNNSGTLNTIAYCLNDCLTDEVFDFAKFRVIEVDNPTTDSKVVALDLIEGLNKFYVYASDLFGNYIYESVTIKYDTVVPAILVKNEVDGKLDLSVYENPSIELEMSDSGSGIAKYCVSLEGGNSSCVNVNSSSYTSTYSIESKGIYYIEVIDNLNNSIVHTVNITSIDNNPISFDLNSSLDSDKYTNGTVTISLVNIRKVKETNASQDIKKIDYVRLDNGSVITSYESIFTNSISVYSSDSDSSLIINFAVSSNGIYVVRVTDIKDRVSYNYIEIVGIDKDVPIFNTNTNSDGTSKIKVTTGSGNNIRYNVDTGTYIYSNEILRIVFEQGSLMDLSNGYNGYLAIKVCFKAEKEECVYNTYGVSSTLSSNYYISKERYVEAPYNFNGTIYYYIVDGAGNSSETKTFDIIYQSQVSNIEVNLKDADGALIDSSKKYNSVSVVFNGDDINEVVANGGIRYSLVESKINLESLFVNRGNISVDTFLNNYGFATASEEEFDVTKVNVDASYYLWIYAKDLLNNNSLFKVDEVVNIDTVAPNFDEINWSLSNEGDSIYKIILGNYIPEYRLYIDATNTGVYELATCEDGECTFEASGVNVVNWKLEDEAGNITYLKGVSLNIANSVYAKAYYQTNDNSKRIVNVVVYNLGNKTIGSISYIMTNIDSSMTFDDSTINSNIDTCNGLEETCISNEYTKVSKNIFTISLESDKKLAIYIYVEGKLAYDNEGNVLQIIVEKDEEKPVINFDSNNAELISTKNENYSFKLAVVEKNLSSLSDIKYILTTDSSISTKDLFNNKYNSCLKSNCIKGTYDLDSNGNGIISINSNEASSLVSGSYYLYTYVIDDFGNYTISNDYMYIDNTSPLVEYSIKDLNGYYSAYIEITNTVYIGSASKIRISDIGASGLYYFEIYNNDTLITTCYFESNDSDYNCLKDSGGEIGFVKDSKYAYHYLDNGNYKIVSYDNIGNVGEIYINVDYSNPVIELYKYSNETYDKQFSSDKIYNSLNDLYIKIIENNFNYLSIDLVNTNTSMVVNSAVRYSYNSAVGNSLLNDTYGIKLVDILVDNTVAYNKIIVNVYDKANRVTSIDINYDDGIPSIWTMNVGESVYIDGLLYLIKENKTIDFEIGVNDSLTLDKVLNKIVLDVDGATYQAIKNNDRFKVVVYDESLKVFNGNIFEIIGNYKITLDYIDIAGNEAETKTIIINVNDNTIPELVISDSNYVFELGEDVVVNGVAAIDNYGIQIGSNGEIIKSVQIPLSKAECSAIVDGETVSCTSIVTKISDNVYKFLEIGEYSFVYTISDISGNENTINQIIKVSDNKGPKMISGEDGGVVSFTKEIGNRVVGAPINVDTISLRYPIATDNNETREVNYLGLYGINNMGEKYKIINDTFIISDLNKTLKYKFDKVGTYYLRFSSSDSSGNISLFDYEVKIIDVITPIISANGLVSDQIIKIGLEEQFSIEESIIEKYSIIARDNYDDNVKIYYDIEPDANYTYKIVMKASDSSNNVTSFIVYVDIIDNLAPIVGELNLPESTNSSSLDFTIVGGEDNSLSWWHEYNIQNGTWKKYSEGSKLEFGTNLNQSIKVCIRAVDSSNNVSASTSCKEILVDTTNPTISGVKNGEISNTELNINVTDDRLSSVKVWCNDDLLNLDIGMLPFNLVDTGNYYLEATDSLGNVTSIAFAISTDTYMDVINDINSTDYTVSSVNFDSRMLLEVNVEYDTKGNSVMKVDLSNVKANKDAMIYILGLVPNQTSAFVIYSLNGSNLENYKDGLLLVDSGELFKQGVNNEDCFLKLNNKYYVYVIVKGNSNEVTGNLSNNSSANNHDNSKVLGALMIGLGAIVTIFVGYQIVKFRKRVRAA